MVTTENKHWDEQAMNYVLALIMMTLFIPTSAIAQGPCAIDKAKFCKDVAKEEIRACLEQHKDELSEACKKKREAQKPAGGQAPAEKKP